MSDKPKKTLSEEQLRKMQEGRKKANEKRKKEREEARKQAKNLNEAKKSNDKEKLLQLELEAMQQQQSRIDNLKLQVERKKQVKSKLKNIKATEEAPEDQIYEQPLQQDDVEQPEAEHSEAEHSEEKVQMQQSIIENILEHVEEEVEHKQDLQAEQHKHYVPTNEEYELVFRTQAKKMRNKIPTDTRKYYDEAVKKFDFTLSLDENIKSMIDYCKNVVNENTLIANNIRNKQIERDNKKEIVQKSVAEKVTEQSVDSKIYKLMKLK